MSDDKPITVVDVGGLAKPVSILIEKIASATAIRYEPTRIKNAAEAEVAANLIKAQGQIDVDDLHRRTQVRLVDEEVRKQVNMEKIIERVLPHLEDHSEPDKMDNDWLSNFFEKSRTTSDAHMQEVWAKVLAGEATTAGSYSKRTVRLLSELDKRDAVLFQNLCQFVWEVDGHLIPVIFDAPDYIYKKSKLSNEALRHLAALGLIIHVGDGYQMPLKDKTQIDTAYDVEKFILTPKKSVTGVPIGKALFTQAGKELSMIVDKKSVFGFQEYTLKKWNEFMIIKLNFGKKS